MNFLLLYKGDYTSTLRGPEMRYFSLAYELNSLGHKVSLCGRTALPEHLPDNVNFVSVHDFKELVKVFFGSDVIVLHGGGPLILFLAILCGFLKKRIVLDGYVPHWIELDELNRAREGFSSIKLLIKSYFNVLRVLFSSLIFDHILVANKRQMDLYRGVVTPFTVTRDFSRVSIIPFGCSNAGFYSKENGKSLLVKLSGGEISEGDFLIGWLGGAYGWFDLKGVINEISKASAKNKNIKAVFFGVAMDYQEELLKNVKPELKKNIIFLPWVEFSTRFDYWSGFDVSLVWGKDGYENDYASRTRNFDCLTLGLPIVQNWDDEWGIRIKTNGGGVVAERNNLSEVLLELSCSHDKVHKMSQSMLDMAPHFYWRRFADTLIDTLSTPPMSVFRRFLGVMSFLFSLPAVFVFFLYALFTAKKS
ncbi:glycosyltransferase family protein [Zobellella maritima]|uniref:hypothetical protein n=1 Tax=Zobellella maritima TaxID=2059725 RepID=UPI0018E53D59|nr:hypothetical protein [Zobellella maritima]